MIYSLIRWSTVNVNGKGNNLFCVYGFFVIHFFCSKFVAFLLTTDTYDKLYMKKSIIVAIADNNVIGKDNDLIWHISEDLKRFKKLTEHHTVVMGRNTYFSLPFRPLKNRRNIVVSRTLVDVEGVEVVDSIDKAFNLVADEQEVFVMGGASIYEQVIDVADRIYLTVVKKTFEGDTYFPKIDESKWSCVEESEVIFDDNEKVEFYYQILDRVR